ncbi:MAG: hypothetical protein M1282_17545 [Chloroflexi bacterium]|nr:hypothetical protein [Chloroflexota bacterium]
MNNAQTLFSFLFAIYFAVTIAYSGKFQPFDTPSIYAKDWRALLRLVVSFLWLNILPILYYVFVMNELSGITNFSFGFWPILALLMFSLAGFGFYRIFFGMMLWKSGKDFIFYGKELPKTFESEWDLRPKAHKNWKAHLIPGLFWVFLCKD